MEITKDINIQQLLQYDLGVAEILQRSGMHCLGCIMAHGENLGEACMAHGIDADGMVEEINAYLASNH